MNYLPLPLHNKSKSITFINSPKLWLQNFLSYLETNNKPLYNTIITCWKVIMAVILIVDMIFIGYFIGYTCFDKDIYKSDIEAYYVLTILGISLCFLIIIILNTLGWFTIFIIQFSLQVYNTIIDLLDSLRAYNSSKNKNEDGYV
jgi:hypothetical protein